MNWKNLKENKCPKCDSPFNDFSFLSPGLIKCESKTKACDFVIRVSRFSEIVNSQVTADLERNWDSEYEK